MLFFLRFVRTASYYDGTKVHFGGQDWTIDKETPVADYSQQFRKLQKYYLKIFHQK